jgi:hypothetical protein
VPDDDHAIGDDYDGYPHRLPVSGILSVCTHIIKHESIKSNTGVGKTA